MKKKYRLHYIFSLVLCLRGLLSYSLSGMINIVFILLGIVWFLITFIRHCISMAQRCPNCNAIIYSGHIRTIARQKDGLVCCEKCGTLVRVIHGNQE